MNIVSNFSLSLKIKSWFCFCPVTTSTRTRRKIPTKIYQKEVYFRSANLHIDLTNLIKRRVYSSLWHLSTSGIYHLLLTWFWQNFSLLVHLLLVDFGGVFLLLSKPQLNHNSTHPNITLSWVRHENDFAYHPTPSPTTTQTQCQQYLSCYWTEFDETLNVGFGKHLEQVPTVMVTFV